MNILIIASPVQAIGEGNAGGVDITLSNIIHSLTIQKHNITVAAPEGSTISSNAKLVTLSGKLQPSIQTDSHNSAIPVHSDGVIVKMCEFALTQQQDYDVILNLAYDWLPIWLTRFAQTPIYHLVSMSNENDNIANALQTLNFHNPARIALHSRKSAQTYQFEKPVTILPTGFAPEAFPFVNYPKPQLAWVGRISPEKGLENAIEIAAKVNMPLHIWGKVQSGQYQTELNFKYQDHDIVWRGFKPHKQLLQEMSESQVLLMTPNWVEAFGNNVVEAICCGVPVVAYNRGGPSEIIDHGITGFIVETDNSEYFADKVKQAASLSRIRCKNHALQKFNFHEYGLRLSRWLGLNR